MLKTNLSDVVKVLYVVDMVDGFVRRGALHDERIAKAIPEQIKLIEKFKEEEQIISFVSLAVVLALSFVTVSVPELYAKQLKTPDSKQYSLLLQNIYQFILQNYVEEPDPAKLYEGAVKGMLDSLNDPYSTYLDEDMMSDLMSDTTGIYGGIGLYISKQATVANENAPR